MDKWSDYLIVGAASYRREGYGIVFNFVVGER